MTLTPDIFNGIVTLLVGSVALIVYKMQKSHEKKSAASIIAMDIRHAEQVVLSILEKGTVDLLTKDVLVENNWSKYKHLFVKDFSQDDFTSFNNFFDSCVEMSDARQRIREVFYSNLTAKAAVYQQKIFDLDYSSPTLQADREALINILGAESLSFDPEEPKNRMFKSLKTMGNLSQSYAFSKLKKIAGMKI